MGPDRGEVAVVGEVAPAAIGDRAASPGSGAGVDEQDRPRLRGHDQVPARAEVVVRLHRAPAVAVEGAAEPGARVLVVEEEGAAATDNERPALSQLLGEGGGLGQDAAWNRFSGKGGSCGAHPEPGENGAARKRCGGGFPRR